MKSKRRQEEELEEEFETVEEFDMDLLLIPGVIILAVAFFTM